MSSREKNHPGDAVYQENMKYIIEERYFAKYNNNPAKFTGKILNNW